MKGPVVAAIAFFAAAFALITWVTIQTEVTGENPLARQGPRTAVPWVLRVGDCFDDGPEWSRDARVTAVDCDESHDSEVIAVESFSTFGDNETPDEITAEAEGECTEVFAKYAASLPMDSRVVLRVYHRSSPHRPARNPFREREWDLACVAWSADGRFGS